MQNTWEDLAPCRLLLVVQDNSLLAVVEVRLLLVVQDNSLLLVVEVRLLEDNSLLVVNSSLRYPLLQDNLLRYQRSLQRRVGLCQGGEDTQHSPQLRTHGKLRPPISTCQLKTCPWDRTPFNLHPHNFQVAALHLG